MQRKVFRIEQMTGRASRARVDHAGDLPAPASELRRPTEAGAPAERELAVLREIIAHHRRELSALIAEGKDRRMARAAGELSAAVEGMETATQKILASVEVIDDCARALASVLTDDYHHGLAQDVQDHVVRVYEACNFQDLAGQRIGKVIAALIMVEERVAAMLDRCNTESASRPAAAAESPSNADSINGPRLDGDSGHASQCDIDAMFA
ncbi:MAG TPA: protein phosphatase CheZ [Pseudolabrys sp.]|nr:protein phosphatase CheZ [Pseudolabrys sp.]